MTDLPHGQPVIVGAGLAGLTAALTTKRPCVVLSPHPLGTGAASPLAQGGIAAALAPDDTPALHAQDTLAAGDGLCDPEAVRAITAQGPDAIQTLLSLGVTFDRTAANTLDLHLEAAHSRPRIAHANGDGSGAEIMRALIRKVRATPRITVLENAKLTALHTRNGNVSGIDIRQDATDITLRTTACIIASGGIGALYEQTTSPAAIAGTGLAMAARAGATLIDLEFVQFHPTALDIETQGRRPLISEAVRGAGGILIDETGNRFTEELAPRDQVARAIAAHLKDRHRVFLDSRPKLGNRFSTHFPTIAAACRAAGLDPDTTPIPVRPAVHYHMGGIATDLHGQTSIPGLWACGEAGCTGLHGANRLASNSLLEAFVIGRAVGNALDGASIASPLTTTAPYRITYNDFRKTLGDSAGILRNSRSLTHALATLTPHARTDAHALTSALICHAALQRQESRGAHFRQDHPGRAPMAKRHAFTMHDILASTPDLIPS